MAETYGDEELPLPSFAEIFGDHIANSANKKRKRNHINSRGVSEDFMQDETTGYVSCTLMG